MFCSKCGEKASQNSMYCSKCGNNLNPNPAIKEAPILTGKIGRKTKLGIFYTVSTYIMGGFLIPFILLLWVAPQLHQSYEGMMMASPIIIYILIYGVAILLFSHFFSTTMISKILVKLTFVVYFLGFILMTFNIPPLIFSFIFIDMGPDLTTVGRRLTSIMLAIVVGTMASYALINALILRRWFKNEKGLTLKKGLGELFKPKFNIGKCFDIIKSLK